MWRPGLFEIIIVLAIIVLLFGPGRISKIAREIGESITAFKDGLQNGSDDNKNEKRDSSESGNHKPD
ncbi:MAG: twin-arginine translocase TatA/TatE family subunit [Chloroflexi bacterium]|jgi:sec-independent protein translocase protein TatA|nr:twin-arginine translocase TatA/TatE family subunit [Chloroflexota bacterium]